MNIGNNLGRGDILTWEKKVERIESIRGLVQEMLLNSGGTCYKNKSGVHLYGVSNFASMLAIRRGQDQEVAGIAGLLQGYYFYKTGIKDFPGPNSADAVRPILRSTQLFSDDELHVILRAIFYHEDILRAHGPYEEIIKDAVLLQMYFQNTGIYSSKAVIRRLHDVFNELGIPEEYAQAESNDDTKTIENNAEDRRLRMADFSEILAAQNIIGIPEDECYREICKYWPDTDIYKVLEGNWCAAFVYYCCMEVGIRLPIRYPNRMYRLAGVGAWLDWAKLPETGFFYRDKHDGFNPERGDIVIYEKLLSDHSHDHIGIVLACDDNKIKVAEGNKDNKNCSGVLYRERSHCILGYIRIDNSYHFNFDGKYTPIS